MASAVAGRAVAVAASTPAVPVWVATSSPVLGVGGGGGGSSPVAGGGEAGPVGEAGR